MDLAIGTWKSLGQHRGLPRYGDRIVLAGGEDDRDPQPAEALESNEPSGVPNEAIEGAGEGGPRVLDRVAGNRDRQLGPGGDSQP